MRDAATLTGLVEEEFMAEHSTIEVLRTGRSLWFARFDPSPARLTRELEAEGYTVVFTPDPHGVSIEVSHER